jgi:hypothetical protein
LQRLPLPVGSRHPVREARRVPRLAIGGRRTFSVLAGLAAAAAGGLLGALPPAIAVGLDGSGYHLGDVTLPQVGPGVYASGQGAVVIEGTRAAGSTALGGRPMRGSCQVSADGRHERCRFQVAGRSITADDQLDGPGWTRRYGDGQVVRIELKGARPVPVPIAIGR